MKWFWLLFLMGCSSAGVDELRKKAKVQAEKLTQILREVDTKEDLTERLPQIKKRYDTIAELVLMARKVPDKEFVEEEKAFDDLFLELARLYETPQCRDLIESAQLDAVQKLY